MKAFVTGATGFIGRRLVERLRNDGVEVTALVRNSEHRLPKDVHIVYGDILNDDFQKGSVWTYDRLYHLAAMVSFDPRKRHSLIRVNCKGTANVLAIAKRWNIGRSVVVSSACTIGLSYTSEHILDENALLERKLIAANPYMESKLLAEKEVLNVLKDLYVVIVNPTTVYGEGDVTLNSGTLVLRIAKSVIMPVPYGGSNVVDVDDVVAGIVAAGERGSSGQRYILGGENLLFAKMFTTIAEVVQKKVLFITLPAWMKHPMTAAAWGYGRISDSRFITSQIVGDMFAFKFFSSERAKQELGWSPRYSFRESVERAWAFYRRSGLV